MYNCARCARRQQRKKNGTVVVSVHYCRVRTREWVLQESGYVRRSDVQFYLTPIYGKKRYTVLPDTNFTACYLATSVITGNYRPGYDGWSGGAATRHIRAVGPNWCRKVGRRPTLVSAEGRLWCRPKADIALRREDVLCGRKICADGISSPAQTTIIKKSHRR
jgi:hypothetical protein